LALDRSLQEAALAAFAAHYGSNVSVAEAERCSSSRGAESPDVRAIKRDRERLGSTLQFAGE